MVVKIIKNLITFSACVVISYGLYLLVESKQTKDAVDKEEVYVLDNIDIEYRYDKDNYDITSVVSSPYAVIRGTNSEVSKFKLSNKKLTFYVDLTDKSPDSYKLPINVEGLPDTLVVETYPFLIDILLSEQQTLSFEPIIDLVGVQKDGYSVTAKDVTKSVRVRGSSETLKSIGVIKGTVDITNISKDTEKRVEMRAYDRNGVVLPNVTILDKTVTVKLGVVKIMTVLNNVTIIEKDQKGEESAPSGVITEGTTTNKQIDTPKPDKSPTETGDKPIYPDSDSKPTKTDFLTIEEKPKTTERLGVLSFINIPSQLELVYTGKDTYYSNVQVDLLDYKEGVYSISLNDGGVSKTVEFTLNVKEKSQPQKESSATTIDTDEDDDVKVIKQEVVD